MLKWGNEIVVVSLKRRADLIMVPNIHKMTITVDFKCMMLLESEMSKLYRALGRKTDPEYCEFWEELRQAELNHIALLNDLYKELFRGNIRLRENHFRAQATNTSRDFVRDKMKFIRENDITMKEALDIAYTVEHSTLDGVMLKMFDDEEEHVKETFARLSDETKMHRDTIAEMVDNYQEPSLFRRVVEKFRNSQ